MEEWFDLWNAYIVLLVLKWTALKKIKDDEIYPLLQVEA